MDLQHCVQSVCLQLLSSWMCIDRVEQQHDAFSLAFGATGIHIIVNVMLIMLHSLAVEKI